jgi:hypothetical protein
MTSSTATTFDPNFEALLREAAAAPRSLLLRVERPQILPTLRSREAPVSVAMAGLTSVERELLASYRSELGFLLRQAALMALMTDPHTSSWIDATVEDRKVHQLPVRSEWNRQCSEVKSALPSGLPDDMHLALECLHHLTTPQSPTTPIQQIAAASMRVEPTDQARVYAGAQLAAIGAMRPSLDVLRTVLDGEASVSNEAFAIEATSLALGRAGRCRDAAIEIRRSLRLSVARPELPMRFLFYSAFAGDPELVEQAARHLCDSVALQDPSIDTLCADIATKIRRGVWELPADSRTSLQRLRFTPDPVSGRILHEILIQG